MKEFLLFFSLIFFLVYSSFAQEDTLVSVSKADLELLGLMKEDTLVSKAYLNELKTFSQEELDSSTVYFVGGADIQKSFTQGEEVPANTGVGFVFDRIYPNNGNFKLFSYIYTYGFINVASTADTIRAKYSASNVVENLYDFGNFILLPSNSKQSATAYFKGYFYREKSKIFNRRFRPCSIFDVIDGFQFRATGANRIMTFASENYNTSALLIRVGIFHDFIPIDKRLNSDYSILIGVDFSQRHLFGDMGQNTFKDRRKEFFNSDQKSFFGAEYYLSFRMKNLVADVSLSSLWPTNGQDFLGLTNTRLITSIKFIGGFPVQFK